MTMWMMQDCNMGSTVLFNTEAELKAFVKKFINAYIDDVGYPPEYHEDYFYREVEINPDFDTWYRGLIE